MERIFSDTITIRGRVYYIFIREDDDGELYVSNETSALIYTINQLSNSNSSGSSITNIVNNRFRVKLIDIEINGALSRIAKKINLAAATFNLKHKECEK